MGNWRISVRKTFHAIDVLGILLHERTHWFSRAAHNFPSVANQINLFCANNRSRNLGVKASVVDREN
jgi:hypothetical protein